MTLAQLRNALAVIPRPYDDCPVEFCGEDGCVSLVAIMVTVSVPADHVTPVVAMLPTPAQPEDLPVPALFLMPGDIIR